MERHRAEEREELVELAVELFRLLLEGPGSPEGHRFFVLEVVRRQSAEEIREMIRDLQGVRLDAAELAELPTDAGARVPPSSRSRQEDYLEPGRGQREKSSILASRGGNEAEEAGG